jgi:hypothetical protein
MWNLKQKTEICEKAYTVLSCRNNITNLTEDIKVYTFIIAVLNCVLKSVYEQNNEALIKKIQTNQVFILKTKTILVSIEK